MRTTVRPGAGVRYGRGVSEPSMRHHPGWFGSVMATAALSAAFYEESEVIGGPAFPVMANVFLVLATLLVIALTPLYALRLRRVRGLAQEIADPGTGALLATFPGGLLVFAATWAVVGAAWLGDGFALTLSAVVAVIGAVLAVALSVKWLSSLSSATFDLAEVNGGWLIPPAISLIVPLCISPQMVAHPDQATWLLGLGLAFYGIGALLFIPIFTLIIARLMLRQPPPNATMPALWTPLAPAGLIGLSLLRLLQAGATAEVIPQDAVVIGVVLSAMGVGLGLWWAAFATVRLTHVRRTGGLPFSPGWWGFVFPLAALELSLGNLADLMTSGPIQAVAFVGFVCLLVVWILVSVRTTSAVLRGARSA